MNFFFPILAAVLQAASFTLDKVVLSLRQVSFKTYIGYSFPLYFLVALVIFLIFRPPLSSELLAGNLGYLILLSLALTIGTNLIFYRALDYDRLGEIQTLDLLHNIPIIIFASILFQDERNFFVLIPALLASLAILWSHWEGHHLQIRKFTLPFLLWSVSAAPVHSAISKVLLQTWHPISLELVRSGALAFVLTPFFSGALKKISPKTAWLLILTNILSSVAWIFYYFSFKLSGIVWTILLFSLQPLLVYFASLVFLKEPLHWKKFTAFIVVLVSIVVAQIMN